MLYASMVPSGENAGQTFRLLALGGPAILSARDEDRCVPLPNDEHVASTEASARHSVARSGRVRDPFAVAWPSSRPWSRRRADCTHDHKGEQSDQEQTSSHRGAASRTPAAQACRHPNYPQHHLVYLRASRSRRTCSGRSGAARPQSWKQLSPMIWLCSLIAMARVREALSPVFPFGEPSLIIVPLCHRNARCSPLLSRLKPTTWPRFEMAVAKDSTSLRGCRGRSCAVLP